MSITIGSDPEIFIADKTGKITSAIPYINYDKEIRYKYEDVEIFHDNVCLEFSVSPSLTKEDFLNNIRKSLYQCKKLLNNEFDFVIKCKANFSEKELLHPEAQKIACDPDWCAYSLNKCVLSKDSYKNINSRFAGGHIHFGVSEWNRYDKLALVRFMDLLFTLTQPINKECIKEEKHRRSLYGQAGRFRKPSHGIEYRTPSNIWLIHPLYCEYVFEMCQFVCNFVLEKKHLEFWKINYEIIEDFNFDDDESKYHLCYYDINELINCIKNLSFDKKLESLSFSLISNELKELRNDVNKLINSNLGKVESVWKI